MKKIIFLLFSVITIFSCSITLELKSGWNLSSFPLDGITTSYISSYFPIDPLIYEYITVHTIYEPVDSLDPSKAYWVLSLSDTTITVSGDSVYCIEYDTLFPGWNMIGVPARPVEIETIRELFDGADIINPQWGYNTDTRGYEEAPVTIPTKGLWLLTADTIVVDTCLLNYPQPGSPLWTVEIDSAAQYYRNISSPSLDEYQNRSLSEVEMSGRQQALIAVNL